MAQNFYYIVDFNTADHFEAHVENDNGDTIFEIINQTHLEELMGDGLFTGINDIENLHAYLVDLKVISDTDILSN